MCSQVVINLLQQSGSEYWDQDYCDCIVCFYATYWWNEYTEVKLPHDDNAAEHILKTWQEMNWATRRLSWSKGKMGSLSCGDLLHSQIILTFPQNTNRDAPVLPKTCSDPAWFSGGWGFGEILASAIITDYMYFSFILPKTTENNNLRTWTVVICVRVASRK